MAIGPLEAKAGPKNFRDESFLHQLEQLKVLLVSSKHIAFYFIYSYGSKYLFTYSWPKFPISPDWRLPAESTTHVDHEFNMKCDCVKLSHNQVIQLKF